MTFSEEWTQEERLKLVLLIATQIQCDIPAGNYGKPIAVDSENRPIACRPNMQSIINVILVPAEDLEEIRDTLEQLVEETIPDEVERRAFYETRLEELNDCERGGALADPTLG